MAPGGSAVVTLAAGPLAGQLVQHRLKFQPAGFDEAAVTVDSARISARGRAWLIGMYDPAG